MNIVVGVSGGIAAYKACHVVRALRELGHTVKVVPTASALTFVGAATWEALSGQPVQTSVFERIDEVEHIRIGQHADLVLIAPATADLIARLRAGRADDLLTVTVISTTAPVVLAPAMHTEMWLNPATVDNVAVLRERGIHVIEPASGRLTGADSGPGRLPEPDDIVTAALDVHRTRTSGTETEAALAGRRVLITAGGTREPLDPVRFLGNRSSGKQGIALARAAAALGAYVTLIAANVDERLLENLSDRITVTGIETTAELQESAQAAQPDADIIIMCAAVADYRPAETAAHKMKKSGDSGLTIELVQNPDILAGLVETRAAGQTIIGFAAETGSPDASAEQLAQQKLLRKGCDMLVLNDVSAGQAFDRDDNSLVVYERVAADVAHGETAGESAGVREVLRTAGPKQNVSQEVMAAVAVRANR
ncbi:bifunctional phosphopantothenoylcysteine decarboxylase/phosphopantothenate--cysteine ligase CoaBC [Brevibacterium luteolum]|uniref:bifunctional phosphopantothenoylcysteine decarboxylase/phosphopantothenate--cysteine ligase CoaBC n=1 Tax=Brevibacterium luteolum TaxID=199591 RepID=UPI0021AEE837|nr:bifunctional phosphopantothenoylcysteine decarboxylase/phosphopantothenate--cysteine ligase CoaBC [Brevibacterium luteolum]MCT1872326.1 bifunctional phosphopantothenoylcysteine decarboxylase/phosphopantothenate--cysteine ligase CoaBC [Brevibacterium luteolum]MCT1892247.1 bifunctional phosphopantothenoylcysteine decarboxylase/phosphopantothenate--cysteine ligase CoaBC [Brevibacterium luteolum]